MKEFKYVVKAEEGLHARPAGLLVKKASSYQQQITIWKDDKSGDAKRLFSVMGLGVKAGEEVTVRVNGEDEERVIAEMELFFSENL